MLKRNTLILAVCAVALAVGAILYDTMGGTKSPDPSLAIMAITADNVAKVAVNDVTLSRQESNQWLVTAPVQTAADEATVNTLIQSLSTLKPVVTVADPGEPKEYGLDPAQSTITTTLKDGSQQTLKVGSPTFDRSAVYALTPKGTIITLPVTDEVALTPDVFQLRDKNIARVNPADLTTIEVRTQGKVSTSLTRQPQGWQLTVPRALPVDEAAVTRLVTQLTQTRVTQFVAENKADLKTYGLDSPDLSLTLTRKTGDPVTVAFGKDKVGLIHVTSSTGATIGIVPESTLNDFAFTPTQIRRKTLAALNPKTVAEITIKAANPALDRALTPLPEGDEWIISDQPERQVSLSGLWDPLTKTEAIEFIPTNDAKVIAALKQPQLTLTLKPRPDQPQMTATLVFAKDSRDPSRVYVRSSDQPDVLVIAGTVLDEMTAVLTALQPLPMTSPSP